MLFAYQKQCCTSPPQPEGSCCKHVPCGKLSSGCRRETHLRNGRMICRHSLVLPASQSRFLTARGRSRNATCSLAKEPKQGRTQLHQAASDNRVKQVKKLLASAADLSIKDDEGFTPLHIAVTFGHMQAARMLLTNGANPDVEALEGITCLSSCVLANQVQLLDLLLSSGADPAIGGTSSTGIKITPLQYAAMADAPACAKRLILHNADLSAVGDEGMSALPLALMRNSRNTAAVLLRNDNDLRQAMLTLPALLFVELLEQTLGEKSSVVPVLDLLQMLLAHATEEDFARAVKEAMPFSLHWIAASDHVDAANMLLSHDVEVDAVAEESMGITPLHYAAFTSAIELATLVVAGQVDQELLDAGLAVKDIKGVFSVLFGDHSLSAEVLRLLLRDGADVSTTDRKGATALHYAASSNNVQGINWLLRCDAKIDAPDCEGNTPLHYGVITDALEAAQCLVANGASVAVRNKQGASPLHAAVGGCQAPSLNDDLKELIAGMFSEVNKEQMAALHAARIKKKGTSMLDFLVSSGANVNCTSDQGLTPLHHAALDGNVLHVQALLAHGADVNAQATIELVNMDSITYPGWTPLQAAIAKGIETKRIRLNTDGGRVQSETEHEHLFQVVSLLVDAGASLSARP